MSKPVKIVAIRNEALMRGSSIHAVTVGIAITADKWQAFQLIVDWKKESPLSFNMEAVPYFGRLLPINEAKESIGRERWAIVSRRQGKYDETPQAKFSGSSFDYPPID